MAHVKRALAICLAPIVVFFVAVVLARISANVGLAWVCAVVIASFVARRRSLPGLGLISKGVANAAIVGALLASVGLIGAYQDEAQARLAALAATNPQAYLAAIRKNDETTWLEELERLDPEAHQQEMARREAEAARREEVRQEQIANLEREVSQAPASDYALNLQYYKKLHALDPNNERYEAKIAHYTEEARAAKTAADAAAKAAKQRSGFHCLSAWDGSHRAVNKYTEERMRDPDSFDHIETRITPADANGNHLLIMKYRARNGFGGMTIGITTASVRNADCRATILSME